MSAAPPETRARFGEIAVARGWATESVVAEALAAQAELARLGLPEKIGEILRKRGQLTAEQVREVLLAQGAGPLRDLLPGFEILEKVGQGGMGAVYRARRRSDGALVALKLLPPHLGQVPDQLSRFLREARAAAALRHPNIVAGLDAGCVDGQHFVAMEFVEGESLDSRLRREAPLPEAEALAIGEAVASALAHAHEKGLVHRDVKPSNILVGRKVGDEDIAGGAAARDAQGVFLADFGIAKWTDADSTAITRTGFGIGTPQYAAPEQARGDPAADARADLYGLGATLYHAAVGRPPYDGTTAADVAARHASSPVPDARVGNPALSAGTARLLERLLAKDPAARPPSAAAVAEEIRGLRNGRARTARMEPAPLAPTERLPARRPPAREGRRVAVGVLLGASLGAAAVVAAYALGLFAPSGPTAPLPPPPPDPAVVEAEIQGLRSLLEEVRPMADEVRRLAGQGAGIPPEVVKGLEALPALEARIRALQQQLEEIRRATEPPRR